jgi:hypothetical protein
LNVIYGSYRCFNNSHAGPRRPWAFRSINSPVQQIAGGVAAAVAAAAAGIIVQQKTELSPLKHYNTVGYVRVCISLLSGVPSLTGKFDGKAKAWRRRYNKFFCWTR